MSSEYRTIPTLTQRIDLNVGYSCNIRCRFCYYINDVRMRNRDKDLSTGRCKRLIAYYFRKGMRTLDLTGGEPTIRKDIFELARFARETGFERICVITNGIMLSDPQYAQRLVASGVNDFLFSLHGSTPETHDYVTNFPGSFEKLNRAVSNLLALKVKVRCNSVVTGTNLSDIYARARLFAGLGVKTVNFIMFNPIEQAVSSGEENYFNYADAAAGLKKAIDDFGKSFDKFTVRYMPLCLMRGYEGYVQNVHQVHYDHDEWDYYLRTYIRQPYPVWLGALCFGAALLPRKFSWLKIGVSHFKHAAILEAHSWLHKHRPAKCRACAYGFICGGVWKRYAAKFSDSQLRPEEGRLIIEPWHFMTEKQRGL